MPEPRTFVEVQRGMKDRLRTAIEALVDVLDSLEPDVDIEDDEREPEADEEESLSHCDTTPPANGYDADLELDTADEEPTLGSLGSSYSLDRPQTEWGRGRWDERGHPDEAEEENEHGGDPNDEGEPMLGSTTSINQERAWNAGGQFQQHPVCEDEPSLGWTGYGHGHPEAVTPGYADDRELVDEDGGGDDNGIGDADGLAEQMTIHVGGFKHVE